jgi:aminopeptidase N
MMRALLLSLLVTPCLAQVPQGIPRELAREQARAVSDVRYRLRFTLAPKAASTSGHEALTFQLKAAALRNLQTAWFIRGQKPLPVAPLLLDFREGTLGIVRVNGIAITATIENGHIALPADRLRAGENTVEMDFTAPVGPAGKAFTSFHDRDDGSDYVYTLFVPMDASMAFPCFDQPDLKARFQLTVTAPIGNDWTVISNTPGGLNTAGQTAEWTFAETRPLPTYLFAFAAGPFKKVNGKPGLPGLYVRQSQLQRAQPEAEEVQTITARGIEFLSQYFAQPFPFSKYDMVMIPGFPYGGMEHAGATFLREESILFRAAPTHTDRLNRDILLLHELTHQWFGDLTTMRWFDDLWLKEGFAQYMAYQALAALKPQEPVWKRFYEAIKPGAYGIDITRGTTPIYQDIPNLKDAKSAYGAIVYSKAPGVLKQLAFVIGGDNFRNGLRLYLREHLYGNAEWSDLVTAFERVSRQPLGKWADMWIKHRGMPQVDVEWACAGGKISRLTLSQHDVLNEGGAWPIAAEVLLKYPESSDDVRVQFDTARAEVAAAAGKPCPEYVFANDHDEAYGLFLLDARSRAAVMKDLPQTREVFRRTLLWGSLWDTVRQAQMPPREYLDLAAKLAPEEQDESLAQSLVSRITTALHRYVPAETRAQFVPQMENAAAERMQHADAQGLRIVWFRGLRGMAETTAGLARLKELLNGKLAVPGVTLRPLDRWGLVTQLIAMKDPEAGEIFAAEHQRDQTGDGQKYAYMAEAARPDEQSKRKYFDDYLHNPQRQEDWIEASLGAFNYWNQSELTAPFLRPALEALPQIKRERKIFFLVGWLNAFLDGQHAAASQKVVYDFLRTAEIGKDLRLKILQAVDELDRTVKIREKYAR